jgi:hypothetical protein
MVALLFGSDGAPRPDCLRLAEPPMLSMPSANPGAPFFFWANAPLRWPPGAGAGRGDTKAPGGLCDHPNEGLERLSADPSQGHLRLLRAGPESLGKLSTPPSRLSSQPAVPRPSCSPSGRIGAAWRHSDASVTPLAETSMLSRGQEARRVGVHHITRPSGGVEGGFTAEASSRRQLQEQTAPSRLPAPRAVRRLLTPQSSNR